MVQKALSGIFRTGQTANMHLLIDILRGAEKDELKEKGYDKLKTYGVGKDLSYKEWKEYLYQMLQLGLLDTPTHGEYYINGKLVDDLTDDQMSVIRNEEIGFIFQGFNLISSLSALENVELPLVYRGMPKQERREISQQALERVGLGSRIHHLPAEMSGGQQQRVAVARAIAAKPPVILADEPTGNLDTKSTKEVMAILHELKDEGRTVIVITHDNEIAEEAERVIRIRDGKVVEDYINPGYEEKYGRESKKNNKNPIDEG